MAMVSIAKRLAGRLAASAEGDVFFPSEIERVSQMILHNNRPGDQKRPILAGFDRDL
jgi:hypothetical protein